MKRTNLEKIRKIAKKSSLFAFIYGIISKIKQYKNRKLSDISYFKKRYKFYMGKEINLDNPSGLNEKIIWLQLYDRNPLYTSLTDKIKVKDFVAKIIGEKYVIPIYKKWNNADHIDFKELPEKFVLKCNHDCGSVFLIRNKKNVNERRIIKKIKKSLRKNYYFVGRVWSYKNIQPFAFAEKIIETEDNKPPRDYKFFCFNGEPKFLFVASNRGEDTKFDFFDLNWNRIPVKQHYPNSSINIPRPKQLNKMIELAAKLSRNIPHVRVDFYIDKHENIYFGEMTFAHFSGKEPFEPSKYDTIFGSFLSLPKKMEGEITDE